MRILKLNFDGSSVTSIHKGGTVGVIRDWNDDVVRSYSRPAHSSDAIEAEVFALLIGYRKLSRLEGLNVVIEDDSCWECW